MSTKILRLTDGGDYVAETPVLTSAGAVNAGRVPVLGDDGFLHHSVVRGGSEHTHVQLVASMAWAVSHNLDTFPDVVVLNEAGAPVIGDVRYDSLNELTLLFSKPLAGKARCR